MALRLNIDSHFVAYHASETRFDERTRYAVSSASPFKDHGAPLTTVVSDNTSALDRTIPVEDSRWFYAEAGSFPSWMGVECGWIAVGPDRNDITTAVKVAIVAVNDATNTISVAEAFDWDPGDFVWLWKDSRGQSVVKGSQPSIGHRDVE